MTKWVRNRGLVDQDNKSKAKIEWLAFCCSVNWNDLIISPGSSQSLKGSIPCMGLQLVSPIHPSHELKKTELFEDKVWVECLTHLMWDELKTAPLNPPPFQTHTHTPASCSLCRGLECAAMRNTGMETFIKGLRPTLCTDAKMRAVEREEWKDPMIFKHHFTHERRCWRCKWRQSKQCVKIPLRGGAALLAKITRDGESCCASASLVLFFMSCSEVSNGLRSKGGTVTSSFLRFEQRSANSQLSFPSP